jgi:beta-1,2-mannobiose phosphorylase / 1,2-beta-oligomannan phosphorylase
MILPRLYEKCLLRPEDLRPSGDAMEILSAFNPGVAVVDGQVVLLVRVAERPKQKRPGYTALPRWLGQEGVVVDWVVNEDLNLVDPRVVEIRATGAKRLTFVSYLRVVRSKDGRTIDTVDDAVMVPETSYEEYGVEDPRITPVGDTFYFTYVAVSRHGAATALGSTRDFRTFTRHGIIFPPENKDALLFPARIDGDYMALHRPNPNTLFSPPEMWTARSPDLVHWGHHERFLGGESSWQLGRVGGGPPPIVFDGDWLEIYHGSNKDPDRPGVGIYSAGAILMDRANPRKILAHTEGPIMIPQADYETEGFLAEIVFPTGIVDRGETILLYYGAADTYVGVVEFSKNDLRKAMTKA